MFTSNFFFLRPWWLLAIVPAIAIVIFVARSVLRGENKAWRNLVDPHLLAALTVKTEGSRRTLWYSAALAVGLVAAIIAIAGPAWEKNHVPTVQAKQPTVVVLSLAHSMNTDDVKPSRIARARHKLDDILDRMAGGDAGLVIYADRPFIAAPLTGDARVIHEMLPELSPNLMPVPGNRLDLAIIEATKLLQQAGAKSGRIVVLANDAGKDADAAAKAAAHANRAGYEVDAIGIGATHGAGKQAASGQATTGVEGKVMTAGYDEPALRAVTGAGGGKFIALTADSGDLDRVFPTRPFQRRTGQQTTAAMDADSWSDAGYCLLFLPVLLAPIAFRRNVLMVLPMLLTVGLIVPTERAEAASWSGFWNTPDQQAKTALEAKDYTAAAQLFENSNWKASALYRAGDYTGAAQNFSGEDNADTTYNRANALAKAGQLQPALEAYNEQLQKFPNDKDPRFNHDLVEKLLQQQEKQQKQDQNQEQEQEREQESEDSQQKDQKQNSEGGQQKQQSQSAGNDASQQDQEKQEGANGKNDAGSDQSQQANNDKPQAQSGTDSEQQDSAGDENGSTARNSDAQSSQSPATELPTAEQQQTAQNTASDASEQQPDQTTATNQQNAAGNDQQQNQQAGKQAKNDDAFSKAMDEALRGNTAPDDQQPESPAPPSANTQGLSEQQQANEQLLRSVPDDPSGLLRARIYQHYALQRRTN